MIIGISGKIGSGKDATAQIIKGLLPHMGWEVKKFAAKLKQTVSLLTGIPVKDLEKPEVKNALIGPEWGDLTYRRLLQLLGEKVRGVHEDAWVNALFSDYAVAKCWLITDLRYPNELEAIKARGGITIRLTRQVEVDPVVAAHPSETALDNANFTYTLHNTGTLDDLTEMLYHIFVQEGLIITE